MSSTILYRAMFVHLKDDTYIPLVECGSNNCYEFNTRGRWQRERSWHVIPFFGREKISFRKEEIFSIVLSYIESVKKDYVNKRNIKDGDGFYTNEYIEKNFGFFSGIGINSANWSNTTAQKFFNFFKRGIDFAVDADKDCGLCIGWNDTDKTRGIHGYCTEIYRGEDDILERYKELKSKGFSPRISFVSGDVLWEYRHQRKAARK